MVIIADGHASRFDLSVLNFLCDKQLILYIIPPDTTGVTKYLDQVNQKIHSAYCSTEDELFTPFNTINREVFILGKFWEMPGRNGYHQKVLLMQPSMGGLAPLD